MAQQKIPLSKKAKILAGFTIIFLVGSALSSMLTITGSTIDPINEDGIRIINIVFFVASFVALFFFLKNKNSRKALKTQFS